MKSIYSLLVALFISALLAGGAVAKFDAPVLTPEVAKNYIETTPDVVILDVRNPNEYEEAHYKNALNIPVLDLETRLKEVPTGKPVLIHCARGVRAERAFTVLKEKRPDLTELYYIMGTPIF